MKLLAWLVALLIRICPHLSASYRHRIRPRQKCPACGAVKTHKIAFDPKQKLVAVTCVVCSAAWGFEPMLNTQKWMKVPEA